MVRDVVSLNTNIQPWQGPLCEEQKHTFVTKQQGEKRLARKLLLLAEEITGQALPLLGTDELDKELQTLNTDKFHISRSHKVEIDGFPKQQFVYKDYNYQNEHIQYLDIYSGSLPPIAPTLSCTIGYR